MDESEIKSTTNIDAEPNPNPNPPRPAKKRSGMSLLRAALFMVRRRSKKTPIHVDVATSGKKGFFKSLIAAIRLLQQPKLENHPPPILLPGPAPEESPAAADDTPRSREREVFLPPPSPCGSESWFSIDGMSRYASTDDLSALDTSGDDEEEVEEVDGGCEGSPNAIDLKAEEFIAMFYAQMRLQRMDSKG